MNQNMNGMNGSPFQRSPGVMAVVKYRMARVNLLFVTVMTAVNVILSALNASISFLFSAFIPRYIVSICYMLAYFPEEIGMEPIAGLDSGALMSVAIVIALIFTVPYLLCWIFSKKHYGWMIAALVVFSLDTVFMLVMFQLQGIILDILFHAWVLYYLIVGVKNGIAAHKAEEEAAKSPAAVQSSSADNVDSVDSVNNVDAEEQTQPEIPSEDTTTASQENGETYTLTDSDVEAEVPPTADSPALRPADLPEGAKVRVYVETTYESHCIQYRIVNKTEELVVDGVVYGEMPRPKKPGCMRVCVAGLSIEAGVYGSSNVITVNGRQVANTIRWI